MSWLTGFSRHLCYWFLSCSHLRMTPSEGWGRFAEGCSGDVGEPVGTGRVGAPSGKELQTLMAGVAGHTERERDTGGHQHPLLQVSPGNYFHSLLRYSPILLFLEPSFLIPEIAPNNTVWYLTFCHLICLGEIPTGGHRKRPNLGWCQTIFHFKNVT